MYESTDRMGLEPVTLARMREVFGGHACVTCGGPAARLHGDRFYCAAHLPTKAVDRSPPRVYRCRLRPDGVGAGC